MWLHVPVTPAMAGSILNRNIVVQTSLSKKQDLVSKINKAERAGGVAQAVDRLPSKCEALSSNLIN
jgi:hypothetical protein